MHGQHCGKRQQQWHMWPGPSQRPVLGTVTDSASGKCFSKAGRKIGVGDCALFQAGNAPPFIGIIRKLTAEKEGNHKLGVNWLYRPGDIKLGKGVSVEATPNEVFYSFHKDEISAASLLHPCKVAFLRKGVELPSGVSSFVCRRVYDVTNKCLYWLTDQNYTDECQQEVDQLLDRTKHEMQAAVQSGVQSGVSSQRAGSGPTSSPQSKTDVTNAAFPCQSKGKKRERTDQSLDPCKRERSMKLEDCDLGPMKRDCSIKLEEIGNITDKDGGLLNIPAVDQLVQVMHQEQNDSAKKSGDVASRRTLLASIVAATERDDCLTRFVQLGGLPVLDDWLQEAHKGKFGDGASPKEGDKAMEELLLTLLRALDKLPIDLDALKTCPVGKSVNNLRSHRNLEIQKKARKLVDTWKKRVDAEIKSPAESKSGLNPATSWSCKQPSNEMHGVKVRCTIEGVGAKSPLGTKPVVNGSCPGDTKCNVISGSGCKEPPGSPLVTVSKDNPVKFHASGTSEVILAAVKEEKSSSSSQSQNNSQSWCSGSVKGAGSWREEVKTSSAVSSGTKTTAMTPHSITHSGKGHSAASLTGPPKESANVKHSVWNKTSGSEKVTSSALMEKGAAESARAAEISNNQRLIVRLPNPGRTPACSANGSPFADGGASASRASPPSLQERHDVMDEKNKSHCAVPAVHSPVATGDAKSGNESGSGGKPGADCTQEKERSCGATADEADCKPLDAEYVKKETEAPLIHSNLSAGKGLADGVQSGFVRKCNAASVGAVGCSETSPEVQDEGGIDLLASVAACEGSEAEKSFSGAVGEGLNSPVNDGSRERAKQSMHLSESDLKDKSEDLLVSNEDDDKWKKLSAKVLLEPGGAAEIMDTGSVSVQDAKGHVDARIEQSLVLTSPQSPEDRSRDGALESTSLSANNVIAARGSEALAGSQDGCGGVKVVRRENTKEEKVSTLKVSTDICTSSSFPGDGQTCTASGSNNVGLLEEGFEDAKKSSSSSPSSLVRMSSMGDVAKAVDSLSGYYEEDALEVARKVAKEVEQEVERYGKPETQDITSFSVSKTEPRLESPVCENANNQLIPSGAVDARVKCPDQVRCRTDTAVYSDGSQETVMEKREGMEVDRIPSAGNEGDEVDQASFSQCISENMRSALEPALGSNDDMKGVRELAVLEGYGQSAQASVNKELVDAAVCNIQAAEAPVLDQAVEFTAVSNDGKCGSSGTSGRPIFDLNEGFVADEVHDDATPAMVPPLNPTVLVPHSPSGPPAVMSSSLATPIAVMAATKGAFIPPSTLSRSKGEPGWKGSAATSAFRPAEPRRITEFQLSSDTPFTGATADVNGQGGKRARVLDIDLNVADERVMEDVGMAMSLPSQNHTTSLGLGSQVPTGSANESSSAGVFANSSAVTSRPELDLNRVDESEESMGPLMSDSRDAEVLVKNDNKFPLASSRVLRDFDLNDGPGLEESMGEVPLSQPSNVRSLENSALPGLPGMRSNPEILNVASWYPAANPLHNMVMPAFSANRAESSYPVVAAPTAKSVITMGHNLSSFSGDLYRAGTVIPSSPAVSYSNGPAPFPYAGIPFGSGFPFTSASYNVSSSPYGVSSSSPPFPTAPSQLVSAGAVVSPYGRPYLMGITEVPGAETCASWTRPNLDLNAGPDAADTDGREEARQMPALGQISFQQGESSGAPLKRKEPESGFDPFRSGVKQMVWR